MFKKISLLIGSILCGVLCVSASYALLVKSSQTGTLPIGERNNVPEDDRTVYFSADWDHCYLYAWDDEAGTKNADYPGREMFKIGLNQYGQYIYKGTLLSTYPKMIFSNGGNNDSDKTPDLIVSDFDFTSGDLLFWKDDSAAHKAGYMKYDSSVVTSYARNLGTNPGPILQAFGWTNDTLRAEINNIANAGYKAVQISPMQPLGSGTSTTEGWYMEYQPLGFKVADNGENPIGNKTTLAQLTAAADAVGVDIIADVVVNHLAAGSNYTLYSGVQAYEPEIYNKNLIHNAGEITQADDNNLYKLVKGNLGGLPDLQTENSIVQNRVISMLKEYIDCGVKGFRFDAAKHVETPEDGEFSSEFWPNVIGSINSYGLDRLGKFPYSYGEVIGIGGTRNWAGYTDYIDVTDNGVAWSSMNSLKNSDEGGIVNAGSYSINSSGENAVLFAESHDNFVHGETSSIFGPKVNMLYGFHASRSNASTFYFARPQSSEQLGNNTKIVVNTAMSDYKNSILTAANKLHNDFIGGSEYLSSYDGCAINARVLGDKYGVYICNPDYDGGDHVNITAKVVVNISGGHIPTGNYTNLINGSTVTVNGSGYLEVALVEGVAVLECDCGISGTKNGSALDLSLYEQDKGDNLGVYVIPDLEIDDVIAFAEGGVAFEVYGVNSASVAHTSSYTVTIAGEHIFYINGSGEIWVVTPTPPAVITPTNLYFRGPAVGGWDALEFQGTQTSANNNRAEFLGVILGTGNFKISTKDWNDNWGYWGYNLNGSWANNYSEGKLGGSAKDNFGDGGDNNINCLVAGTYNFYINENNDLYVTLA